MTSVPVPIATTPSRLITIRPWALPVGGSQMTADGSRRPSGIGTGSRASGTTPSGCRCRPGSPGRSPSGLDADDDGAAPVLVEPAHRSRSRWGGRRCLPGVTIQNSSPGLRPRSYPPSRYRRLWSVKSVCSASFSAPMTAARTARLRAEVAEAGDLVLEAERLGRRVGRVGRRGGLDAGDRPAAAGASPATGELRAPAEREEWPPPRKEKGHWTGNANGETHGDSLKNTDIRGF